MLDIVYPYKQKGDGTELRYSLRSLKNVPHRNVFIVGDCPDWVENITHIKIPQDQMTKYANARGNIVAACEHSDLSDDFILMNDDFYVMSPLPDVPVLHRGDLDHFISSWPHRSAYYDLMVSTRTVLRSIGIERANFYEIHIPTVINKHQLLAMLEDFKGEQFMFRTLYHNYYRSGGTSHPDVKKNTPKDDFNEPVFLSSSDAIAKHMYFRSIMRRRFRQPCYYEAYEKVRVSKQEDRQKGLLGCADES